jgi:hypothetical protein
MSEDLVPRYKEMAADGIHFPGTAIMTHSQDIKKLVKQYDVKKILDYGCGRGDQYKAPHRIHADWGLKWWDVKLYDPAFERLDERPLGKHDLVVCSDVLEHIPEDQVEDVIGELFFFASKAVWASVCCRPAKKVFPNTEINLHVTIQPLPWWEAKFEEVRSAMGLQIPFHLVETP